MCGWGRDRVTFPEIDTKPFKISPLVAQTISRTRLRGRRITGEAIIMMPYTIVGAE